MHRARRRKRSTNPPRGDRENASQPLFMRVRGGSRERDRRNKESFFDEQSRQVVENTGPHSENGLKIRHNELTAKPNRSQKRGQRGHKGGERQEPGLVVRNSGIEGIADWPLNIDDWGAVPYAKFLSAIRQSEITGLAFFSQCRCGKRICTCAPGERQFSP